jgi:phosphoenolpyruvate carboxykinase (GTP)
MPLVFQAFNWSHGVYLAATMGSEATAAATGCGRRAPRPDGHAALLRLQHGRLFHPLAQRGAPGANPPRIFRVNWFRKDDDGKFSGRASARTCAC